jgi:hypothetical protein
MDVHVHRAAIRFIESLNRGVDAESFSDDDAWALMQDLVSEYALPGKSLTTAQVAALRDFGHTAGIKPGAPLGAYLPGLEAALGPCQLSADDRDQLVRWAHGQVNAAFEDRPAKQVELDAEPRGPVPPPRKPLW